MASFSQKPCRTQLFLKNFLNFLNFIHHSILRNLIKCYPHFMNVYDLLHKELKRLDIKEESIKDEIKDLPLGTLVRIKRNDNSYVYLKHRENRKVISVYVGKEDDQNVVKIEADLRKRMVLERELKKTDEEKTLIQKMLKVK